jgi:hypothetical protein
MEKENLLVEKPPGLLARATLRVCGWALSKALPGWSVMVYSPAFVKAAEEHFRQKFGPPPTDEQKQPGDAQHQHFGNYA